MLHSIWIRLLLEQCLALTHTSLVDMEQETHSATNMTNPEDEQFEIRPWVKYAAIGFGMAILAAVEFATYRVGYERGYTDATASGEVKASVNAAAVKNLQHFLQVASMDDARLNEMVSNHKTALEWIQEPKVRDEAEWLLGSTLVERGRVDQALPMLEPLFGRVGMTEVWARRQELVARGAATAGLRDAALAYYRGAAERYRVLGMEPARVALYSEMVQLLASSSSAGESEVELLNQLQQEMTSLGAAGQELRSHVLAYLGNVYRAKGQHDTALQYFEKALAGVDTGKSPSVASAAVCYGAALLEKGEVEAAEKLLREGVSRLGDTPNDTAFLVVALRDLARLEQERGRPDKAMALLYRAEGAADGRISPESTFWLCLYDQRGWVHFSRGDYEAAMADFEQAAAQQVKAELLIQPLEGAGRCSIALGRAEAAQRYLRRCVDLRLSTLPADTESLGRVNLLLGQACDMAGDVESAAKAYAAAIEQLPEATEENPDRMYAMMGCAYAQSQLKNWDVAIELWSQIIESAHVDNARKNEAKNQLTFCLQYSKPQSISGAAANAAQ